MVNTILSNEARIVMTIDNTQNITRYDIRLIIMSVWTIKHRNYVFEVCDIDRFPSLKTGNIDNFETILLWTMLNCKRCLDKEDKVTLCKPLVIILS